ELSLESLTDEQGRTQSFKEQGKSFDRSGGHVTLYYDLLDPHKTKKLTIQLRVVEKSPSLRVMKWYRHFQFRLNLPAPSPRSASVSTTLQTAASPGAEGARITLEQLRWFGETSAKQIWQQSYLWLRDRDAAGPSTSDPLAATLEWRLKALTARDADNHSVQVSFVEMGQNAPVTWRSDGVPVAPGESGYFLDFLWDNTRLLPSLTLDATVELVRHWNHNADFPVVPLPSAGHPAAANRPGKNVSSEQNIKPSDPGAGIVLRRIMRVADPDTLSILSAWQRQKVPPGALALLFEVAPRAEKTKLRLRVPWVEDEAGQSWQDSDSIIVVAGSFGASLPPATMTSGPADAQWWTVVLRPQQAPAQHLHIQVAVEETTLQGELRTLSLRDVPTASKPGFRH
ncbi:MAG: hypothetical protein JOZ57_04735, partial [Abitibacteriaceae bacterium]|nr:hypothetical protein [Abditibacteriaceae bacterium]